MGTFYIGRVYRKGLYENGNNMDMCKILSMYIEYVFFFLFLFFIFFFFFFSFLVNSLLLFYFILLFILVLF